MYKIYLLISLSLLALPSTVLSASLGLRCQFIPYTHCSYQITITRHITNLEDITRGLYIDYSGENITLHPGLFNHTVRLNDDVLLSEVFMRIRDGQISFNQRYNEVFFQTISDLIPGRIRMEIQSQRVPILVKNKDKPVGWMSLKLMQRESQSDSNPIELSSSSVRMKPTNGCWLDEHACVDYPD